MTMAASRSRTLDSPLVAPEVRAWLQAPKKLLIGSRWVEAQSGKTFSVVDPSTGETLAEVAEADVELAVGAARRAFEGSWSTISPAERARLMWVLSDLMEQHALELAQLESLDTGKPINETQAVDVPLAIEQIRYFAGWATKITGQTLPVSFRASI